MDTNVTLTIADDLTGVAVFDGGRFLRFVPRAELAALLAALPEPEPAPTDTPPAG